ncbi:MAG: DNA polymerase [Pseudomonadota bacterium]
MDSCRTHGFVSTMFGRKVFLPQINAKNGMHRQYSERQAINAPIQGSAADIIKRAMIRLPDALGEAGIDTAHMLLQIHDELIFEVHASEKDALIAVARSIMEEANLPLCPIHVPLVVDCGFGNNWDEAH